MPEIAFVGPSDAMGRVVGLVNALLAELAALSLGGAGRDVLRSLVAVLGRVRAGADAAEARTVTALEGLGDGGVDAVEVLRRHAGSSQREAQRRKRRAEALAEMPNVAGALAAGDISPEHAEALARAAAATSHEAVDGDADLLAQVAGVPADRAGRQIQTWTQRNQDPADLHEQHLRQRRRRRLNFGDGDDGMLMAHAAFDRVLGTQFRSLINGIADRIWRAEGGRDNPDSRSAEQRRLDALAIAVGLEPEPTAGAAAGAWGSAAGGAGATGGRDKSPPGAQEPSRPDRTAPRGTASNRRTAHDRETQEPSPTERLGGTASNRRTAHDRETQEPSGPDRTARHGGTASNRRTAHDRETQEPSGPDRTTRHDGTASNRPTAHDRETQEPSGPDRTARHGGTERDRRAAGGRAEPNAPAGAAGRGSASGRGDVAIDDRVDGPAMSARRDGGAGCTESPRPQPLPPSRQPVPARPEPGSPRSQPVPPRHQIVIVASADVVTGKDPQGRCEIPGVGPIPQSELERLACDAELFGVLFSGDGDPLWHGRGERTVTDAQRRALLVRDGVCVLCAEEPARCESHHIVPWAKPGEGPTDIDNLAFLCGTCHRRVHDHKRVLTRSPDGAWGTAPDPRHARRRKHPDPHHTDTTAGSGARAQASGAAATGFRPPRE